MDEHEYIVKINNLKKFYGDIPAVDGVSFNVKKGEVFGMLGPNGAGKTTIIEIIEGMRLADSGTATINGFDIRKNPKSVKKIIGVQLQQNSFFDYLNLSEIIELYASLYGYKLNPFDLLSKVGLVQKQKAHYKELSGGQKQRLSIAVALVNNPIVLFLDEPTTGLDPQARRHVWNLVKKIRTEGSTIIMTTHYMEEAEELCDRVAIIDSGKIIALGPPDILIDNLLSKGFESTRTLKKATLDDVFLDLTGQNLNDD